VNILLMLTRLEHALGRSNLAEQIVLIPQTNFSKKRSQAISLVVGYNGSPRSQSALDLTLWIAHQTRLATGVQVMVQVVYVVNMETACAVKSLVTSEIMPSPRKVSQDSPGVHAPIQEIATVGVDNFDAEGWSPNPLLVRQAIATTHYCQNDQFEQADQILWQARHMAEEWRGSLKTHLRFGQVAQELRQVTQAESASVLVLGCTSAEHPLVRQLGTTFPCPVLGIPLLA
jgi:hypothetical protein